MRPATAPGRLSIIHCQSSFINPPGFTLIELLVVIAIVALLLAILFPALRAGRSHARTVKCQGTLHQWGLYYATYTTENDHKLPVNLGKNLALPDVLPTSSYKRYHEDPDGYRVYWDLHVYRRLLLCPEASALPAGPEASLVGVLGRTHSPWAWHWPDNPILSSYGFNAWTPVAIPSSGPSQLGKPIWTSCLIKGAAGVPTYFDCMLEFACPQETDAPPPTEDASHELLGWFGMRACVMDRHRGGINSLFMDWSVRKVGVKEPWTLKWSPEYNTAGKWTKQGRVQPEDWPQWMRGFKDY